MITTKKDFLKKKKIQFKEYYDEVERGITEIIWKHQVGKDIIDTYKAARSAAKEIREFIERNEER